MPLWLIIALAVVLVFLTIMVGYWLQKKGTEMERPARSGDEDASG